MVWRARAACKPSGTRLGPTCRVVSAVSFPSIDVKGDDTSL